MKKPLLNELTLREKIGQMVHVRPHHIYVDKETGNAQTQEKAKEIIEREQYGSLWVEDAYGYAKFTDVSGAVERARSSISEYDESGKTVFPYSSRHKKWVDEQSKLFKIPPLATGDFSRGAGRNYKDFEMVSSLITMGATGDTELAYQMGRCIAKELRCAGVNWRWSPVVDIANRFTCTVCRTFVQNDADKMIAFANAHIKGMQDEGVAASAKHFPGGDRIEHRDSHFCPATINSTMEEWWNEQGKIFKGIIDGGVYSVMVAHKSFPAYDDRKIGDLYVPSTLSKKIVTDLLKGELGFKGVVITDDIGMGGVRAMYDYETLVVELVNAGNDVLLSSEPETVDIIEKAVKDGRISEERIDDAAQRILDMKEKLGLFDESYGELAYTSQEALAETRRVDTLVAEKSITLLRDRNNLFPIDREKTKRISIIVSSHYEKYIENLEVFKEELEKRGASVYMQRRLSDFDELKRISDNSDLIIYSAYVDMHTPMGGPFLFGEECGTYFHAFSSGAEKSMGVSMGYPYVHFDVMENARTFVNTYSLNEKSIRALVRAMYGEIPFEGVSPVNLDDCRR